MKSLKEQIDQIQNEFNDALHKAQTSQQLEKIRITFLGRSGTIAQLIEQFKTCSPNEKRSLGPLLNTLRQTGHTAYEIKEKQLQKNAQQTTQSRTQYFDVTAYKYQQLDGSLHIYTHIIEHIQNIFMSMGYTIADGPEVETEYYNFQALNIPVDHPARDMHDTFWLFQPQHLLRTHTSTIQIHYMESHRTPLAICAPGRVYRHEETDASHDFMFTQTEGLFIDKAVSMSNLLATTRVFLQALFANSNLKTRVRPGYFPFVEPGIEIDASCPFCTTGCSVCKKTGWIELMGAGLVHPNVLRMSGIDPDQYSGFAFGFGIERIAMINYGITDIRLFHSTKIPILKQW